MTCRAEIEERAHDLKSASRTKQIEALQTEEFREIMHNISFAEIIEAMTETSNGEFMKRVERAVAMNDYTTIGVQVCAIVNGWAALKAVKKVDRMIERGDV